MTATVAVVGGGYGGITAAKALDDVADVVLIEPRDAFVHNVAALRAVVDPDWTDRLFLPYDGLLSRGHVLHDRAVAISAGAVALGSGAEIGADYVVLATGSTFPYPAKIDVDDDQVSAKAKLRATHDELGRASRVLLLGAGPVGLEFAGEIKAAWPQKAVTIVEPRPQLVAGRFPDAFRSALHAQLEELGVELLLGTSLRELPVTAPGRAGTFTVTTQESIDLTADIWFACYGATPNTRAFAAELSMARQPDGRVAVTPELRIPGHDTIFALGDVTAIPELKMARLAQQHAEVVAANIRAAIEGRDDLVAYQPAADAIVLPLGPGGGVSYAPEVGVLGAETTADIKRNLYLDMYLELLGVPEAV
jgi:NADH dehydrogenase FAD-containing subunit